MQSGHRKSGIRASAFTTTITPFKQDGSFDEAGARGHFRRMGEAGIGVYIGTGGSGEGYSLTTQETSRLLKIAREEIGTRAPVRSMGVEPRNAQQMIDFLRLARDAGMDASQVYCLDVGHGHAPTPRELETYFIDVLEAVKDIPLVLSTHQSVGYKIPAQQITDLVERYPQIIGINCSHQDLGYLAQIIDGPGKLVDVHVGGPYQALVCLSFGGNGFLASEGNLAPHLCKRVADTFTANDLAGCTDAFSRVVKLSTGLYGLGGIRVTKAVLNRLGLPGGYPRKPRLIATEAELAQAMQIVRELDIARFETWDLK